MEEILSIGRKMNLLLQEVEVLVQDHHLLVHQVEVQIALLLVVIDQREKD